MATGRALVQEVVDGLGVRSIADQLDVPQHEVASVVAALSGALLSCELHVRTIRRRVLRSTRGRTS
jgi:hypothetical protein